MRLKTKVNQGVSVAEMKDGQVAVVLDFLHQGEATGKVVQRYKDVLIELGGGEGRAWDTLLSLSPVVLENYRVEILPPGTELVI
jgi:hypothetical protein